MSALRAWLAIPDRLQAAIAGLPPRALDFRAEPEAFSMREWVHHLVEANLVASSMLVCALGTDGGTFDWSWLWPSPEWMRRLGYDKAPVRPSLAALRALQRHVAGLLAATDGGLRRRVTLFDTPDGKRYRRTVEQLLAAEVAHAREHLRDVARLRARWVRTGARR